MRVPMFRVPRLVAKDLEYNFNNSWAILWELDNICPILIKGRSDLESAPYAKVEFISNELGLVDLS
jgi:hypothetical protein